MTSMRESTADWKKLEELLSITSRLLLSQIIEFSLVRETLFGLHVFNVIIGCGLNLRKHGPPCSLSRLASTDISMEGVLANLMARLSRYWDAFLLADGSFADFEERYKNAWLHRRVVVQSLHVPLLTVGDIAGGTGGSNFIVTARRRCADCWG
jgi:hypothetical protein